MKRFLPLILAMAFGTSLLADQEPKADYPLILEITS